MRSHPFDAVSAALGLIVVAIGAVVALDGTDAIDTGWWLALGALVLGLGLVPWTRTDAPTAMPIRRKHPPSCSEPRRQISLRHRRPRRTRRAVSRRGTSAEWP